MTLCLQSNDRIAKTVVLGERKIKAQSYKNKQVPQLQLYMTSSGAHPAFDSINRSTIPNRIMPHGCIRTVSLPALPKHGQNERASFRWHAKCRKGAERVAWQSKQSHDKSIKVPFCPSRSPVSSATCERENDANRQINMGKREIFE